MNLRRRLASAATVAILVLSACAREPARIGFIAGLTGNQAELGLACRDGATLAIEEANAKGGLRGRRVELVVEDDGNDTATLSAAIARFRQEGLRVIIGPATSTMAEQALAAAPDFLFVSPTASAERLAGKDDRLIRLMASNARAAALLAVEARGRGLARTVAIAWDDGNKAYAADFIAAFSSAWTDSGGASPSERAFAGSGGDAAVAEAAKALATAGTEAVLVVASGSDAATMIRILERERYAGLVMLAGWAVTSDIAAYGSRALDGVLFAQQYNPSSTDAPVVAFKERYQARFGVRPAFGAMFAWEATSTLLGAMAATGSDNPERIKRAILEAPPGEGLEGDISFDPMGDTGRAARVFVFRDGVAVPFQ